MKTLKAKIEKELSMIEDLEREYPEREMDHKTLDLVYKLSKALVYLDKAHEVMDGKESGKIFKSVGNTTVMQQG